MLEGLSVSNLFDENEELKLWQKMLNDFQLTQNLTLNNSNSWELSVLNDKGNCETIIYLKHHLIKNNQILAIEKLIPKKLYSLSILLENELPTSQ